MNTRVEWRHGLTGLGFVLCLCAPLPASAGPVAGQHGSVRSGQPYLGIDVRDVADEEVVQLKLHDARGAEITRVDHDGPAGRMGLHVRDVVLQLNGVMVEDEDHMRRMLNDLFPGRAVTLVISRDGQQMTLAATMADRSEVDRQAWQRHLAPLPASPAPAPAASLDDTDSEAIAGVPVPRYGKSFLGTLLMSPSYTGAMLEKMGPQLAQFFGAQAGMGLLVRSVEDNSPAQAAGMRAGDIVLKANLHEVRSMSDWAKQIKDAKGHPVTVTVLRDRQERTLTLIPDGKRRSSVDLPAEPWQQPTTCARLEL